MKKIFLHPIVTAVMVILITSVKLNGQVRTPTLYVTGTVLSEEKMLMSVLGTKTFEGNVVSAELNGKKTEAKTDNKGHAILDFSAIASGLVGQSVAVIKSFDKNGKLIGTANTTVQQGTPGLVRPVIEQLPKNIPNGDAVTIPGQNLGADAKLTCGDQFQETLSASDKELTVFTDVKTGEQPLYVTTPNGVSKSQIVNIYSIDFALSKNSIMPKEKVQANVHYESIPVGTKLIFTNMSPGTIKMTIPGGINAANECIYEVSEKNRTIPVNIIGIKKGNFKIGLDLDFKNEKETKKTITPGKGKEIFHPKDQLPVDSKQHCICVNISMKRPDKYYYAEALPGEANPDLFTIKIPPLTFLINCQPNDGNKCQYSFGFEGIQVPAIGITLTGANFEKDEIEIPVNNWGQPFEFYSNKGGEQEDILGSKLKITTMVPGKDVMASRVINCGESEDLVNNLSEGKIYFFLVFLSKMREKNSKGKYVLKFPPLTVFAECNGIKSKIGVVDWLNIVIDWKKFN